MNSLIQALRGLAVMMVVFYHSRLIFPGGFVGVDVFFVISGFLIASTLFRQLAESHSYPRVIRKFYVRRFMRLVPALSVTTLVSVTISFFVFSPYIEFSQISVSAISALTFVANARFFLLNDYTSLTADPFRHAWSLAVEEQFYLIFPFGVIAIVMLFGRKNYLRNLLLASLILVITSFVLSVALSQGIRITPLPRRFAFYSPFSRAWQIGLGVLLAVVQDRVVIWMGRRGLARVVVMVGTFLIVFSGVKLDESVDHPGVRAVAPVLGAVLVIAGGLALSDWRPPVIRLFQHFGDISYSLYLIHWPLLVLARRALSDTELVALLSIPAAYPLAVLQFRLVERRFWSPKRPLDASTSP